MAGMVLVALRRAAAQRARGNQRAVTICCGATPRCKYCNEGRERKLCVVVCARANLDLEARPEANRPALPSRLYYRFIMPRTEELGSS